jgi:hypothetical protein
LIFQQWRPGKVRRCFARSNLLMQDGDVMRINRRVKSICFGIAPLVLTVLVAVPALAGLLATATISTSQTSALFNYSILLKNAGTTNIGTLWFGWIPGYDFLNASPTNLSVPAGWLAYSPGGAGTYSLEMYNNSGSPIAPGNTGAFSFTSTETPAQLAGNALFGNKVTTSFVYVGSPQSDPGYQFNISIVPEPSSLVLLMLAVPAAGLVILGQRRCRRVQIGTVDCLVPTQSVGTHCRDALRRDTSS